MITITLPPEVEAAVREEARRIVEHGRSHKTEKYGAQDDPERQANRLQRNEDGFGAEEAVALWLGVKRSQHGIVLGGFEADLTNLVEVRTTRHFHGRLIVHPEEADDSPFVLAVGQLPTFSIVGWMMGADAKSPLYWDNSPRVRHPAYFVPQADLRQMADLKGGAVLQSLKCDCGRDMTEIVSLLAGWFQAKCPSHGIQTVR